MSHIAEASRPSTVSVVRGWQQIYVDQSSCWSYVGCGEAKGGQRVSWWNGEAASWGERRLEKGKIMVGTYHSTFQSLNGL